MTDYWNPPSEAKAFVPSSVRPTMRLIELTKYAKKLNDGDYLVMLMDPKSYRVSVWKDRHLIGFLPDHRSHFTWWLKHALYNERVPLVQSHKSVQKSELVVSLFVKTSSDSHLEDIEFSKQRDGWKALPNGWEPPPLPIEKRNRGCAALLLPAIAMPVVAVSIGELFA